MGQEEVIKYLKANPNEWLTSKEISTELNISLNSVTTSLRSLREYNEVEYKRSKKIIGSRPPFVYKYKK